MYTYPMINFPKNVKATPCKTISHTKLTPTKHGVVKTTTTFTPAAKPSDIKLPVKKIRRSK